MSDKKVEVKKLSNGSSDSNSSNKIKKMSDKIKVADNSTQKKPNFTRKSVNDDNDRDDSIFGSLDSDD